MSVLTQEPPILEPTAPSIPSEPLTFTQEDKDSLISVVPIPVPIPIPIPVLPTINEASAANTTPSVANTPLSGTTTLPIDKEKLRKPSLPLALASTTMPASRHASLASALPIPAGAATILSPSDHIPICQETVTLNTGQKIPVVGHGSMEPGGAFLPTENARIVTVLAQAIRHGLRLIDTAKVYATEELVGRAVRESGVPRSEMCIVTALSIQDLDDVKGGFEESLSRLHLDYIDIFLLPVPQSDSNLTSFLATWSGMTELLGPTCLSIGLSNPSLPFLTTLLSHITNNPTITIPSVIQCPINPLFPQPSLVSLCHTHNIAVLASSPLGGGPLSPYGEEYRRLYDNAILQELASKYHEFPNSEAVGKLLLSWAFSRGTVALSHGDGVEEVIGNLRVLRMETEDIEIIVGFGAGDVQGDMAGDGQGDVEMS